MKPYISAILVSIFSLTFTSQVFAGDTMKLMHLIDNGVEDNQQKINELAQDLTEFEKLLIYSDKKKDPILPFLLNGVVGAGIGSFTSGDTTGGLIQLGGEAGGLLLMFAGTYLVIAAAEDYSKESPVGGSSSYSTSFVLGLMAMNFVGILSVLGFRAYGLYQPFAYASNYNMQLESALKSSKISFGSALKNGGFELSASYDF